MEADCSVYAERSYAEQTGGLSVGAAMEKRPRTPSPPLCRCIACRGEDPVGLVIKPINDEKDRFLLFHIRREQYANRPL